MGNKNKKNIYEGCQSEQNNVTNMSAILRQIDTI